MKQNKAFTLAEVLIVLMVIGAIAGLTLPNLMKGVEQAQWKAGFQKGYTAVSNIAATETVGGSLPTSADFNGVVQFFTSLAQNLSVKEYSDIAATSTALMKVGDAKSGVKLGNTQTAGEGAIVGDTSDANTTITKQTLSAGVFSPWIIAEDGIAYSVGYISQGQCLKKDKINNKPSNKPAFQDLFQKACVVVYVDSNGLYKGPNKPASQAGDTMEANKKLDLDGDRFYILVGSDGAATGPKECIATGRIVANTK